MLAILEQYITAKQMVVIAERQIEEAKLILQTSTDSKMKSKCNYILVECKELKKLINIKLQKIRPGIEKNLTIEFDQIHQTIELDKI